MHLGEDWAYREPPFVVGKPFSRVELIQFGPPKSNKVRVLLLNGEFVGLDRWVPRRRLTVPWDAADAYLADEARYEAVIRAARHIKGTAEYGAAWMAFSAYPCPDGILLDWRVADSGSVTISNLESVCTDLGCTSDQLLADPLAFINRHGEFVGPWSVALPLARRVAERFPQEVLKHVRVEEKELEEAAIYGKEAQWACCDTPFHIPGERHAQELKDKQSVFELVRSWCGSAPRARFDENEALRIEIARLRELVTEASRWLRSSGHPQIASRMLKAVHEPAKKSD